MRSCILRVLLFIALLSCKVQGKTQLLFANITETGKNAKVRATCVSDDYNDAITWITLTPAEFIKPVTGNESSLYIEFIWRNYGWDEEVAFNATFGPVMDYTWEIFPIVMTKSALLTQNYKFEKLADINIRNHFEINFSFLGKSSAQIYLCSNHLIKRGECIIFIVGGWNGEGSVIRRCKEGASPINSENRLKGCENVVNKIDHKPLFSIDAWSQISIRYVNQQLEIIINDERLLSYQAENENEFNNFTKLFIHSNTESALWKYHEYSYYEARKPFFNFINSNWFFMDSSHLCISFFAKFTEDITLQLYDVSHELIKTEYYKSDPNTQWNYKTFDSDVYEDAEYYLRISFNPNDKIAIRNNVNHLDCNGNKTNNFHFSSLEYNFDSANNIKCSSLRHKTTQFKISLPYQSTDVFTSDNQNQCNICSEFYNTTECPYRITCNEELCYCSPGHTGKYCEENCGRGKYGCNCASECANCNSNFCNPVNGECYFGCNDLKYIGPFCNETNLLVLTGIASTHTDCITNCTITIYDKGVKYDGAREPKYYYTRLFQPNGTVTEGELTPIKVNVINFTNLTKESNYNYQIVLCSSDTRSECYINDLTTFEFETTCEELHKDQIQIHSIHKSTTINVTSYNSNTNCLLDEYYILILDEANNTVQYSKQFELSNTISSLKVFTNYTLQLTRNKTIIHDIVFTTDESVLKTVRNLTANSSSPTKLTVVWTAPIPVLGIITNYVVTWMLLDKRDCVIDTKKFKYPL
ncbi:uncharacterized protein [Atheta coriaria]|uniref:uncharacterized protein n=1 Tax=Dalotia coriaria TaxID=877792 RepID=UPI0031F3C77C